MAFLQTNGTKFSLSGQDFHIHSGSIYKYNGDHTWDQAYLDEKFAQAVKSKFNMIRFVNFYPDYDGDDPYAEIEWQMVDYGLNKARLAGIKILLDLSNYRNFLLRSGIDPYTYDWNTFVTFVCNRINTVNGLTYKNDDAIGMYSISGEAPGADFSKLVAHFGNTANYIRAQDTNHIISPGGIEPYNPLMAITALPNIDCICSHSYFESEQVTRWPQHKAASEAYNKPWFVEEFGQAQNWGDIGRAETMRRMYNIGLKNGSAGFSFWNFGSQVFPSSDDIDTQTPFTHQTNRYYSHIKDYSPRLPTYATDENIIQ